MIKKKYLINNFYKRLFTDNSYENNVIESLPTSLYTVFSTPKQIFNTFPPKYHIFSSIQIHFNELIKNYDLQLQDAIEDLNRYGYKKIVHITITKNPKITDIINKKFIGRSTIKNFETIIIEIIIPVYYF
jgi:hypothetical protein